jgi:hypothetical protein
MIVSNFGDAANQPAAEDFSAQAPREARAAAIGQ